MSTKTSIIHANFNGHVYDFNEDGWFNATTAAAYYSKRPNDWLILDSTKEYIAALARLSNREESSLLKTKRGGNQRTNTRNSGNGGTWFHPKLAVPFARWLNVEFAIWCDLQIDALIRGQHPHFDWKQQRLESTVENKLMCATLQMVRADQGKDTATHHYTNEQRLINSILTGEFKPVDRTALNAADLALLAKLELKNTVLIGCKVDYADRKAALQQYAVDLRTPRQPALTRDYPQLALAA